LKFLENIKLIQGGMGVYVSNWRLARAVANEKPGVCAGTVSGTGLDVVYTRLLQLGDPGGHLRRALQAFDSQFNTSIGQRIIDRYFIENGKQPEARYKYPPKQVVHNLRGNKLIPKPVSSQGPVELTMEDEVIELLIATCFAEVWLAKENHSGRIFINFMHKIELPLIYCMYGAMLAGVDGMIVGAGNPDGLPKVCSLLTTHQQVTHPLVVLYRESGEDFQLVFDPKTFADGVFTKVPLNRPAFLAIVSSENLATSLAQSMSEKPDGLVIEHHTAGGHNASPQGPLILDDRGQPIYGTADEPDFGSIRQTGLPFWLAGGYSTREKIQLALSLGANGVQVGSIFSMSKESGLQPSHKTAILNKLRQGVEDSELVQTTLFSPTGYPFKVANLEGTLSEESVYQNRQRVCDLGLLQQRALGKTKEDGSRLMTQRCVAEPIDHFTNKRGLERNTKDRRCLCNGLLAAVGLGQIIDQQGLAVEEPAIITLGNNLGSIRRLSRNGQTEYWVKDVITDLLG